MGRRSNQSYEVRQMKKMSDPIKYPWVLSVPCLILDSSGKTIDIDSTKPPQLHYLETEEEARENDIIHYRHTGFHCEVHHRV